MAGSSYLLLGGSDQQNGDYSLLRSIAEGNARRVPRWSCLKETKVGDELWFYISAPISAIVAVGEAMDDYKPGKSWSYDVKVGNVHWIEPHLTLPQLRKLFPKWAWLKQTRGKTSLDPAQAQRLRAQLARLKPAPETNGVTPKRIVAGAGFGTAEQNGKVERAAVRYVRKRYEEQGFTVETVEREKIGYDLVARKGRRELHIEVKGVAGSLPAFPITANEVRAARDDDKFSIAVVLNALTRQRQMVEMTGEQFISQYNLKPISFVATPKRG